MKTSLPEIRVHDLRHSHASMLIVMKFDVLEISKRLRHESVKTTLDTYAQLYPEKDTRLARELDKLRCLHMSVGTEETKRPRNVDFISFPVKMSVMAKYIFAYDYFSFSLSSLEEVQNA